MTSAVMQVLERLGGTSLHRLAENVHVAALTVLGLFWITPFFGLLLRRMTQERETLWIRFWQCPVCDQLNRKTYVKCQRCEKMRPVRWRDKWQTSALAERLSRMSQRFGSLRRALGWLLFFGLPAGVLWAFRLHTFHQNPFREILGSAALLLLLLFIFFFRAALRSGWRSPLDGLVNLVVSGAMACLFLTTCFLWATAPFRPDKPLASVQAASDGRIRWTDSAGRQTTTTAGVQPNQVMFHVHYAVLSWPLLGVDQTFVTQVQGTPVIEPSTLSLLKRGAAILKNDGGPGPRVVLLEQVLIAVPGRAYEITIPASKIGLTLRELKPPSH